MARILCKDLWKKYGGKVDAVKGINLEVKDKEFFSFLGPSGCGKTSTMRMIAGLEDITSGEIWIGDRLVNDLPPPERDVAMAFETYALYPTMTVRENLAFPLMVRKESKAKTEERVKEVARILDLSDVLDKRPSQVSGGHQQRVSLGRCIIRQPNVYLFDEPLSHVDSDARRRMRLEIKRLQEVLGTTSVYVTHDQLEAMALADRILVMNLGEIQQVGTPDEIYHHPRNMFVADFIGEPPFNFIEAELSAVDGGWAFKTADGSCEIPIPATMRAKIGERSDAHLVVGIRPRYISPSLVETAECNAKGSVYVFENLGERGILTVDVAGNVLRIVTAPDFGGRIGDPVWLALDMEHTHVFDPATTLNLTV